MSDSARSPHWLDPSGALVVSATQLEVVGARSYRVFSQRPTLDLDLDFERARAHAARFFAAEIGLAHARSSAGARRDRDACAVMVRSEDDGIFATRALFGRIATSDDRDDAARAEATSRAGGLAELAARCPTVWHVAAPEAGEGHDREGLLVAAVFASVWLGPIVDPLGRSIFGVRGAREALARLGDAPYR